MRIVDKVRSLRRKQTDAEKTFWKCVRNRQLNGIKFYRQYSIGPYVVDFVSRENDLVVEIDGGQHNENEADRIRDRYLEDQGYQVLRFWNNEVLGNMDGVMQEILKALTPTLSLKGEGVLPHPKMERWKYTNLPRALKDKALTPASLGWGKDVALLKPEAPGAEQYKDTQLWDLNTKSTQDIRIITGDDDITINAADGQLLSPRLVIHVKDGETATIVERHSGAGAYWKNGVTQIVIGKNAKLNHYRIFNEAEEGVNTSFVHVQIGRDSTYEGFNFIEGAGFIRNQVHAEIQGENAHAQVSGINLLTGKQHADTTITIEHQAPNCTSNQTYKSVLAGSAHCVFQGKVHVHQIAQKTDGYQLSNALILSPLAQMDTKPELEIYADDVKCSHGATTGKLDDEPLFYMRARGIPEKQARALLIESFCAQALDHVNDAMREELQERIGQWLATQI